MLASAIAIIGVAATGASADASSKLRPSATIHRGELIITGTTRADIVVLRLSRFTPELLVVDFGDDGWPDGLFLRQRFDRITIASLAGDDTVRIDEANGAFTDTEPTVIDTGDGNDVTQGGSGNETISGGNGDDAVDGGRGDDAAFLGAGDDRFTWDPGEGSDVVEGEDGFDTMLFNGSDDNERFELAAADGRVRFTRDLGTIAMDVDGIEQLDLAALDGRDTIVTPTSPAPISPCSTRSWSSPPVPERATRRPTSSPCSARSRPTP